MLYQLSYSHHSRNVHRPFKEADRAQRVNKPPPQVNITPDNNTLSLILAFFYPRSDYEAPHPSMTDTLFPGRRTTLPSISSRNI